MKIKFFSTAVAVLAVASVAYATKLAVVEINKNGGIQPTFDKVRDGTVSTINKVKASPVVSTLASVLAILRNLRSVANDNFVGEIAGEQLLAEVG